MSVEFYVSGLQELRLPAEIETVLYRVTQESLNNVAKHAGAEQIQMVL